MFLLDMCVTSLYCFRSTRSRFFRISTQCKSGLNRTRRNCLAPWTVKVDLDSSGVEPSASAGAAPFTKAEKLAWLIASDQSATRDDQIMIMTTTFIAVQGALSKSALLSYFRRGARLKVPHIRCNPNNSTHTHT